MGKFRTDEIRNVCFVGHGDSGKTTLADTLIHRAGAVTRKGSVKEKSSLFDFDDLEKEKHHTIDSAVAHCEWHSNLLNIIDTPGYPDFFGETIAAIVATDCSCVCVNAHNGVQLNTRRAFDAATKIGKARIIVVTKCETEDGNPDEVLEDIRAAFGRRVIPVTWPNAMGAKFSSVTDILHLKGGTDAKLKEFWSQFIETAVEADDAIMAKYLDGTELTDEDLRTVFHLAVAQGLIFPLVFLSAEKGIGDQDFLNALLRLAPSPNTASPAKLYKQKNGEGEGQDIVVKMDGPVYGQVFKLHIDRHVGKVAYLRIHTGTLKGGDTVHIGGAAKKEKIDVVKTPMGKDLTPIEAAEPGSIIAITKMDHLTIGETVTTDDHPLYLPPIPFPKPMAELAVRPHARADEAKFGDVLHKLADEYPTFVMHRDPATHEVIAAGLSRLHLDTIFRRCKDRFGIDVESSAARIPYRECITAAAEGHYRHKKQTGGHGQFAEVMLKVAPGASGEGLHFEWAIVGGTIPSNFRPAIEKGIIEKMAHGVIAGYPIQDIRVSIYDGKFHAVDSNEASFKIAGARAFAEGVMKARPVLFEPIVEAEIHVPASSMGDVSGDLNQRRGHIVGMEAAGDFQILKARVPRSEMAEYARVLAALTSGEGSYTYHDVGYEQVPANLSAAIIAQFKPKEEHE